MRAELKYGLLAGFAVCLWMLIEYALGLHTKYLDAWQYTDAASFIVFVPPLWLLLKSRQAALAPGEPLSLLVAVLQAMLMSLIAALVIYVFTVAYTFFLNPGWVDTVLAWKVEHWRAAHETEESIRRQITSYRNLHAPVGLAASLLISTPLLGGILAVFLTVWLNLRARRAR
ncbi:MAG: DUF4199 domain-containing protein [Opitutae bacterium]|nr:DUF4199 domain-containing protein [Opitutae bacterium]